MKDHNNMLIKNLTEINNQQLEKNKKTNAKKDEISNEESEKSIEEKPKTENKSVTFNNQKEIYEYTRGKISNSLISN